MYFGLTDEEKMLEKSVRDLLRKHFPIEEVRRFMDDSVLSRKLQKMIGEQGIVGILAEEEKKISGMMSAIAAFEETGRAVLPYPLLENVLGAYILSLDPKFDWLYKQLVTGEKVLTIGIESVSTFAVQEGNGFRANGVLTGVPFANEADYLLTVMPVQGTGETPSDELTVVVLDLHRPGIHFFERSSFDQTYPLFQVEIGNFPFTEENAVLGLGEGKRLVEKINAIGAILSSAELLGIADEVLKRSVEYTKVRKQFDQVIAKFQALKHMAAEMFTLLESARVAVYYAGWVMEERVEPEAISIAKAYSSDMATKLTTMGIQMHGGIGFTWESDMHLFLKRARRLAVQFGDAYAHREKVIQYVSQRVSQ